MSVVVDKWKSTITNYPKEIKLSDKRKAVYYKITDKIPKKYLDKKRYDFVNNILTNKDTGEKVIKNSKTSGKPRFITINAQKIYVGVHHSVRSKIVNKIHEMFNEAFKRDFPSTIDTSNGKIYIHLKFYDIISNNLPDLDNLANLFVKCGIDCLTTSNNPNQEQGGYSHKLGIIPDDKVKFIPYISYEFKEVTKEEDRKLEFTLYKVDNSFSLSSLLDSKIVANTDPKIFYSDL